MSAPMAGTSLLWISERHAINPNNIVWMFRGTHGELEITFAAGKQLSINERDLSEAGREFLIPDDSLPPVALYDAR